MVSGPQENVSELLLCQVPVLCREPTLALTFGMYAYPGTLLATERLWLTFLRYADNGAPPGGRD